MQFQRAGNCSTGEVLGRADLGRKLGKERFLRASLALPMNRVVKARQHAAERGVVRNDHIAD